MVNILIEDKYRANSQLSEVLDGFISYLNVHKQKIKINTNIEAVGKGIRLLVIFGLSMNWIENALNYCQKNGIHPLVYGARPRFHMTPFSYISKDLVLCFYSLVEAVIHDNANIKTIAFVGFNPNSPHDLYKQEGFFKACDNYGAKGEVFQNSGKPTEMIRRLISEEDRFDALFFANDALLFLYFKEKEGPVNKVIGSYGKYRMKSKTGHKYYAVDIDYNESARVLGSLFLFLNKQKTIYPSNIKILPKVYYGDQEIHLENDIMYPPEMNVDFYKDEDIANIQKLERMHELMDETDKKILFKIYNKEKYEDIAEDCFLSLNTVKYRLGKLLKEVGVPTKEKLFELLDQYKIKVEDW